MVIRKGKAATSGPNPKPNFLALVPAEPEPLKSSLEESYSDPLDGEEEENEISNKQVVSMEEEKNEIIGGLLTDNVNEEEDQIANKVNEEGNDAVNEVNVDGAEVIEDNEEDPEEDKEPVTYGLDIEDVNAREEIKGSKMAAEGEITIDECMASSEHGITVKNITDDLENEREANKLNPEESMHILVDKDECTRENAGFASDIKEVPENVKKSKNKLLKKKVVKKKLVLGTDLAAINNFKTMFSIGNDALGQSYKLDTNEHAKKEEKSESIANGITEVIDDVKRSKKKLSKEKMVKKEMAPGADVDPIEKFKTIFSIGNDALGQAYKLDTNEHVEPEEKSDAKPPVKVKKKPLKKKVVEKKMVPGTDVDPIDNFRTIFSIGNDALGQAYKLDTNEHAEKEEKPDTKPPVKLKKKLNKMTKKEMPASSDEQKAKLMTDEQKDKQNRVSDEQDVKNVEVAKFWDSVKNSKRKKKKKVVKEDANKVVTKDINKPGPSQNKSSESTDIKGMIFMCTSQTKKDCDRYKVLGLPASKKDVVFKIYKGMRLFLFDFQRRVMYGIYKAAAPGGYNIEPSAFNSQFPSQVRFEVLKGCLPLAEGEFKWVIKDNYYSKNKFNCELTNQQVKNLCMLFHKSRKEANSKRVDETRLAGAPSSGPRGKKRKTVEDSRRTGSHSSLKRGKRREQVQEEVRHVPVVAHNRYQHPVVYEDNRGMGSHSSLNQGSRQQVQVQGEVRHVPVVADIRYQHPVVYEDNRTSLNLGSREHVQEEVRHVPMVDDDRYYQRPIVYEIEPHVAPVALYRPPQTQNPPPRTLHYSYGTPSGVNNYRRSSVLEPREPSLLSSQELRPAVEPNHRDPYVTYREPQVHREPAYETHVPAYETRVPAFETRVPAYQTLEPAYESRQPAYETRQPAYETSQPAAYETAVGGQHYDYSSDRRQVEYYTSADYRAPLPLYRRYGEQL